MQVQTEERVASSEKPSVVIDPHPIRVSVMLDKQGNQIDPVTRQIIKKAEEL